MKKTEISTDRAPQAIGPYSQAVIIGTTLFASGQIPIDPTSGVIESTDATAQTEQVLKNIAAILESVKLDFSDVVKTTVYLTDLADFAAVNDVYAKCFPKPYPARSCVQVAALPKGAKVEIEIVAALKK